LSWYFCYFFSWSLVLYLFAFFFDTQCSKG
jgi:hypothetical protein